MEEALMALWAGLPVFLVHSATSLVFLVVAAFIYTRITPHDEITLIREGNVAAALSFGGAIVGLALPLASSLAASVSLWDLLFWGVVAFILQLIAFRLVDLFLKDLSRRIEAGEMGAAVMLVSFKLATAMINAAAISG
jgi:putative membrane protein